MHGVKHRGETTALSHLLPLLLRRPCDKWTNEKNVTEPCNSFSRGFFPLNASSLATYNFSYNSQINIAICHHYPSRRPVLFRLINARGNFIEFLRVISFVQRRSDRVLQVNTTQGDKTCNYVETGNF